MTLLLIVALLAACAIAIYWWADAAASRVAADQLSLSLQDQPPTQEEIMRINLTKLASELCTGIPGAAGEAGKTSLTVAQAKDLLAALGDRWRAVPSQTAAAEFAAITQRAGKTAAT